MTPITNAVESPKAKRERPVDRSKPWTFQGIRIRPLRRARRLGGYSYRVECGSKFGRREWRQFPTWEQAESYAAAKHIELLNHGTAAFALTDDQRNAARKAFDALAKASLGPEDLQSAVVFYIRHHRPEGGDISLDKLVDRFLKAKRSGKFTKSGGELRQRSLNDLEYRLFKFSDDFGKRLVKDITAEEISEWLDNPEWTRQTRRSYHTILGNLWRYALERKHCGSNPFKDGTRLPKPARLGDDEREIGVLKIEEALALLQAARMHPELELGWFVALGLFCGARTAELERLGVADVRLDRKFLHIGPEVAKKRRRRNVDFTVSVSEEVTTIGPDGKSRTERLHVELDPVSKWLAVCLPPKNERICPVAFRYRWMRLLSYCGWTQRDPKTKKWQFLKRWPANAMRHTYASMLHEATGDTTLVSARLGHTDGGDLLFEHYRALVDKDAGQRFFRLSPPGGVGNIVPMNQPAQSDVPEDAVRVGALAS